MDISSHKYSPRYTGWLFALFCCISLLGYLFIGCSTYRCGFPLDDAWIHQTYARNLVDYREWSFIPCHPSAGSTSPMWTILLSMGYLLRVEPLYWTTFLGFCCLFFLSVLIYRVYLFTFPDQPQLALWGGLLIIFEWHFVWAALSGMETLLCTLCYTFILLYSHFKYRSWVFIGILVGFSCWVRPDAVTIILALLIIIYAQGENWTKRISMLVKFSLGFMLIVIPYFLFNYFISGNLLPTTFFAKQAEYAELRSLPFINRFVQQALLLVVGVGILTLPGYCYQIIIQIKNRDYQALSGSIWMFSFILLYTFRLPVTYQHGRYLLPIFPLYLYWGITGLVQLRITFINYWNQLLKLVWYGSIVITLIIFWVIGGKAYGRDVAFIESEMVDMAYWINANVESGSKLAVHDIGAIGYFTHFSIIDLAGLINPEVIPFIRDEIRLEDFIDSHKADYLVVFSSWYPYLIKNRQLLYTSGNYLNYPITLDHLSIFEW